MRAAGLDEVDVGNEDRDPGEEAEDRHQVDEVAEDGARAAADAHEGQAAEAGGEGEGGHGHTLLVGLGEELGSEALHGLAVEGTGSDVQVGVGGGEDEDEDGRVHDVVEVLDAGHFNGDDEGRGSGGALVAGRTALGGGDEDLAVVGHAHSEEEDGEDVEDDDTPEGQLDGAGNVAARVLGFANSDTDQLGSQESEDGSDHGGPDGEETAPAAGGNVGVERARIVPVAETNGVLALDTAAGDADEENEEADDDDDFDRGQPELEFTEESDAEVVDCDDDDHENGNPDTGVDSFCWQPKLYDQGSCRQLVWRDDDVFEPVGISEGETESRVTETGGVGGETTSSGKPCCHLAEGAHDDVDEHTDERVSDEDGGRAGFLKSRASSNDQTSTFQNVSLGLTAPSLLPNTTYRQHHR